jgi:hypothetical protein
LDFGQHYENELVPQMAWDIVYECVKFDTDFMRQLDETVSGSELVIYSYKASSVVGASSYQPDYEVWGEARDYGELMRVMANACLRHDIVRYLETCDTDAFCQVRYSRIAPTHFLHGHADKAEDAKEDLLSRLGRLGIPHLFELADSEGQFDEDGVYAWLEFFP